MRLTVAARYTHAKETKKTKRRRNNNNEKIKSKLAQQSMNKLKQHQHRRDLKINQKKKRTKWKIWSRVRTHETFVHYLQKNASLRPYSLVRPAKIGFPWIFMQMRSNWICFFHFVFFCRIFVAVVVSSFWRRSVLVENLSMIVLSLFYIMSYIRWTYTNVLTIQLSNKQLYLGNTKQTSPAN